MNILALIGRISFSLIFFATGLSDFWDTTINYAGSHGVSLPYLIIPLSGIFSVLGALSILLGFKTKAGAWLIILFVLPVLFMTNKFWLVSNPEQMMTKANDLIRDLSMLSGAFLFAYFGAGQLSFDPKPRDPTSGETEKVDFTYDKILSGHNGQFFSNDHSL